MVSELSRVFVDCISSDNINNATNFYDNILMHIYMISGLESKRRERRNE